MCSLKLQHWLAISPLRHSNLHIILHWWKLEAIFVRRIKITWESNLYVFQASKSEIWKWRWLFVRVFVENFSLFESGSSLDSKSAQWRRFYRTFGLENKAQTDWKLRVISHINILEFLTLIVSKSWPCYGNFYGQQQWDLRSSLISTETGEK